MSTAAKGRMLYALDPGTDQSALVTVWLDGGPVAGHMWENGELLSALREASTLLPAHHVIEEVASYGMPVGREVFQTVFWSGRFAEAWSTDLRRSWSLLPRKDVKLTLCGSMKAKDANIRQALIDRYGGPACVKKGGALAGIKSHLWAALALAVTYQELHKS
jgi:hypothetical protein